MNKQLNRVKKLVGFAITASAFSSVMLLANCFIGINENLDGILRIVFPILFWVGLAAEQIFIWSANALRKKLQNGKRKDRNPVGVVAFCKTRVGTVTDIVFAVAVVLYIILALSKVGEAFMQYILICIVVLSFRLHCIFNGRNYRMMNSIKRKVDEDV